MSADELRAIAAALQEQCEDAAWELRGIPMPDTEQAAIVTERLSAYADALGIIAIAIHGRTEPSTVSGAPVLLDQHGKRVVA